METFKEDSSGDKLISEPIKKGENYNNSFDGNNKSTKKDIDESPSKQFLGQKESTSEKELFRESAYSLIFEGVYKKLGKGSSGETPEEKAQDFVGKISWRVPDRIGKIQEQNLTNKEIYSEIWSRMDSYITRYQGTQEFEEKKEKAQNIYLKLTEHINSLVENGEVDPLTAKVFVRDLINYKSIGQIFYKHITEVHDVTGEILHEKSPSYHEAVNRFCDKYEEKDMLPGSFINFNIPSEDINTRIYITPDLTQSPAHVLDAWYDSLIQAGLKEKLYFKFPEGLANREELIVAYLTDATKPEDIEKLLEAFLVNCPPVFLSSTPMPSGVYIARGITMSPELRNIKKFLEYSGKNESISYNQWLAASLKLAFELAYYNQTTTKNNADITPRLLKDSAKDYFKKIVKLSGINPETMVQNSLGGELPAWASRK